MENNYLVAAVRKLKPNSEFSITDNNYSTVKWDVLVGNAPTQTEIDVAIEQVKAEEIQAEATKATAKAAAESKLAALGLTTNDLRALGL